MIVLIQIRYSFTLRRLDLKPESKWTPGGRKKRRGSFTGWHQLTPPSLRASRSLLRNMREALQGTTLRYCISAISYTQHHGFHHNQRMS